MSFEEFLQFGRDFSLIPNIASTHVLLRAYRAAECLDSGDHLLPDLRRVDSLDSIGPENPGSPPEPPPEAAAAAAAALALVAEEPVSPKKPGQGSRKKLDGKGSKGMTKDPMRRLDSMKPSDPKSERVPGSRFQSGLGMPAPSDTASVTDTADGTITPGSTSQFQSASQLGVQNSRSRLPGELSLREGFGVTAFAEALCRTVFHYLACYGNSVQGGTCSRTKLIWLVTYLRCALGHARQSAERKSSRTRSAGLIKAMETVGAELFRMPGVGDRPESCTSVMLGVSDSPPPVEVSQEEKDAAAAAEAAQQAEITEMAESKLQEIFKMCDVSGDGTIRAWELMKACRSNPSVAAFLGVPKAIMDSGDIDELRNFWTDKLKLIFDQLQGDGSGDPMQDNELCWDEFKKLHMATMRAAVEVSVQNAPPSAAAPAAPSSAEQKQRRPNGGKHSNLPPIQALQKNKQDDSTAVPSDDFSTVQRIGGELKSQAAVHASRLAFKQNVFHRLREPGAGNAPPAEKPNPAAWVEVQQRGFEDLNCWFGKVANSCTTPPPSNEFAVWLQERVEKMILDNQRLNG